MYRLEFITSLFVIAALLGSQPVKAALTEIDSTIKSIDEKAHGITVIYQIDGNQKTIELDVSRKTEIIVNGSLGTLQLLRSGQKAKVSFDNELQIAITIKATGKGTVQLPANQEAADTFQSDILLSKKTYDQTVATITADYLKTLKESLTELTQRGDLDTAVAIRDKIKWLESQQKAGNIIMDKLAGSTWINTNKVTFEWKKDGSFYRNGIRTSCALVDARRVIVVFNPHHIDMLVFDDKFQTFEQWNSSNNDAPLFTARRVKSGN
jgi:hypothetical protein